jgi:RNA polymerase sigma-70 factor (ECF subfamily)
MKGAGLPDDAWVNAHYDRVVRSAWLLCGNGDVAEELAQETFANAIDGWDRFEGRSEVSTWLYSILFRLHSKQRRSARRAAERLRKWFDMARSQPAKHDDPAFQLVNRAWRESLWAEVAKLPPRQQQVVVLRFAEGFSYQQIADTCGCPLGTAKTRLHGALNRLREKHQVQQIQDTVESISRIPATASIDPNSFQLRS